MKEIAMRVLYVIPILVGISIIIFFLTNIVPGDPILTMLGPDAPKEAVDKLTKALGLDQSLPVQYFLWLTNVLKGNLGLSRAQNIPVYDMISHAFLNTLILATTAAVIAVVAGFAIGAIAAYKKNSFIDRLISSFALVGLSIPSFWFGILLITFYSVTLGLLPSSGMTTPFTGGGFVDILKHMILPASAAAIVPLGVITRMARSNIIDILSKDYITTLHAHGLRKLTVFKHVLKNSLPPLLTVGGLEIGQLLGGAVLVETVFAWPGLGQTLYSAISQRDLPVLQGGVLLATTTFVFINLIVDITNKKINPKTNRTNN